MAVKQLGADEAIARGVKGLARFDDPWGNTNELYFGAAVDEEPFVSPKNVSGFLTDGVGIGHVLFVVPSSWDAANFYIKAMGFTLTDFFSWGPNSGDLPAHDAPSPQHRVRRPADSPAVPASTTS